MEKRCLNFLRNVSFRTQILVLVGLSLIVTLVVQLEPTEAADFGARFWSRTYNLNTSPDFQTDKGISVYAKGQQILVFAQHQIEDDSFGLNRHEPVILTLSQNSNELSRRYLSLPIEMWEFGSAEQTQDQGFLFSGIFVDHSYNFTSRIIKLDANGMPEWSWISPEYNTFQTFAHQISDGSYVAIGSVPDPTGIGYIVNVKKFSPNGTILWDYTYEFGQPDEMDLYISQLEETSDHGFIGTGSMNNIFDPQNSRPFLFKLDSLGQLQWFRSPRIPINLQFPVNSGYGEVVCEDKINGGYVMVARFFNVQGYTNHTLAFFKTDSDGRMVQTPVSHNYHASPLFLNAGRQTIDGGFIFGGGLYEPNSAKAVLFKTSSDLEKEWAVHFTTNYSNISFSKRAIDLAPNGGYLLTGENGNYPGTNTLVIRTNDRGFPGMPF